VPLFAAALALRIGLGRVARGPERPERPAQRGAHAVEGRAGALELPAGGRIVARLARLHGGEDAAARERQAFDARALGARLALEEGEPFRLQLEWRAGLTREAGGVDTPAAPALALGDLAVRDARGTALVALASPSSRPGEPSDPLAVLLAPPHEALRPGESVELVVWGREPGEGAAVVAALLDAGEPETLEIALGSRALVARGEAELARVERGASR
jgi:hypothetical protein